MQETSGLRWISKVNIKGEYQGTCYEDGVWEKENRVSCQNASIPSPHGRSCSSIEYLTSSHPCRSKDCLNGCLFPLFFVHHQKRENDEAMRRAHADTEGGGLLESRVKERESGRKKSRVIRMSQGNLRKKKRDSRRKGMEFSALTAWTCCVWKLCEADRG